MTRFASICLAFIAAAATSGCMPTTVRTAAELASARLTAMKAQASRQQQLIAAQRASLARSTAESQERARLFEGRNADLPVAWRVREEKRKTLFLNELQSRDAALEADPYLLVRKPPAPTFATSAPSVGGLDTAIDALKRMGGDGAMDANEIGAFLFDVAGRIELPKQQAPATGDSSGTSQSTPNQ